MKNDKEYTTELNGTVLIGSYNELVLLIRKSGLLGNKIEKI